MLKSIKAKVRSWFRPAPAKDEKTMIHKASTSTGRSYSSLQRIPKLKTAPPGPAKVKQAPLFSKRARKALFRRNKKVRLGNVKVWMGDAPVNQISDPIPDRAALPVSPVAVKTAKNKARNKRNKNAARAALKRTATSEAQPQRPRTLRRMKHKIEIREKRAELKSLKAELERAEGRAA